jgi:anti-sigma-K factor RskA
VWPKIEQRLWFRKPSSLWKALGLIASGAAADQSLGEVPALAVSLEPQGGSPTGQPTGPVLCTGPCVKYW